MTQSFAQGSRTRLAYIPESTYGVTPATPTTVQIPFVSFNINQTIDQFQDTSIRGDRQERTLNSGNTHIAGDFDVQLTHSNFDPFFASLLTGTWSSNVLKVGSTSSSFTMEMASLDIGEYFVYTGLVMDKLALTVNATSNVTAKFTVMGQNASNSTTTLCATPTAPNASAPFTHLGGTFKEGGTVTALISSIALNIDNAMNGNFTLGNATTQALSEGMFKASGTLTVMFQDAVIANKFLAGTATSLDFTLTDGTNTYEFSMPNVKYTGVTRQIKDQGTITLSVPFTALYDNTSGSVLTITRSS